MTQLGAALAPVLTGGDCLALRGAVGAGKSVLSRSIILARLDAPEDVPSPTFTIVQTYDAEGFEIWHCDLYRLTHIDQIDELGLEDAMDHALCLIEWPEIMDALLPKRTLYVDLKTQGDARVLTLSSNDTAWERRLQGVL